MSRPRPRRDWAWYGWGDPDRDRELPEATLELLRERIGETERTPPVALADVRVGGPRKLPVAVAAAAGGAEAIFTGREDRIRHATGKSYPDLLRLRRGELADIPDAVLLPADANRVAAVIEACADERVAVVPYGGGTSVVGGLDVVRGHYTAVVSLDLSRLDTVDVDPVSLTAELGAGLRGPQAEEELAGHGLTLGHFPQSYHYATIGGYAATRSAGQASSGYGRFDDLVTAVQVQTPRGPLRTLETPHTAAGPALLELLLGSEGTLGVITEVSVRVRRSPAHRRYEAWMARSFADGREALRELAQSDLLPDVLRLSDREETRAAMAATGDGGIGRRLGAAYLRLRRRAGGCLVIAGWEGESESVRRRRELGARVLRSSGAAYLGTSAGRSWERGRFDGPYLRDSLISHGIMVETLETSHTWSRLDQLYTAIGKALRETLEGGGTAPIVLCHVSHVYRDGASLYFTFIAKQRQGEELEQWREAKAAASKAIVATGGTITHHHAVGRDHAPYMVSEIGELGLDALRAVKARLDPAGVMNPGKLLRAL